MLIKEKPFADLTPVVFQFTCPFCHRGYEQTAPKCINPPTELVCEECTASYNAKVKANFKLEPFYDKVARKFGNRGKDDPERRANVAHWQSMADTNDIHIRCRYEAMIELERKVRNGIEPGNEAPSKMRYN